MNRLLFVFALFLAAPSVAQACSTCMDPREGSRTLLWVTIFLSLLPLGLVGSIAGFFWWRARTVRSLLVPAPALPSQESR